MAFAWLEAANQPNSSRHSFSYRALTLCRRALAANFSKQGLGLGEGFVPFGFGVEIFQKLFG